MEKEVKEETGEKGKTFKETLEEKIDQNLLSHIASGASLVMRATVWLIFISGYALSAIVFYRWAQMSFGQFLFENFDEKKSILHPLLVSIELLILMPVPAIIGLATFRIFLHLGETNEFDQVQTKEQVYLTEQLLIGGLFTVTGTTLLDVLIRDASWVQFGGGMAIILSLCFFLRFSGH